MKRFLQMSAMMLGLALLAAAPVRAENPKGYVDLATPQPTEDPTKIEIVELFWYGCPHCNQLEPLLDVWVSTQPEDVQFVRMPAVLNPRWELLGRAYYTAELLGVLDKIHKPLFHAIHAEKKHFDSEAQVARFFVDQGVDETKFKEAFNSFGVSAKVNRARQMTMKYAISGVPALIINGKYRSSASEAGSHQAMLKVVDQLIEQERAAAKTAAP